jgi:hypothetical protein
VTALRLLYAAALLLAIVANTCAVVDGRPSDHLTLILLCIVGLGVGWFMLGGDR